MKLYKLIAALLDYPTAITPDIIMEAHEIAGSSEAALKSDRGHIDRFAKALAGKPLSEWQADYSDLFDTAQQLSLYLFEHIYGSSRLRGKAMSDLIETYREAGVEVASGELPDYLPVFLEFLSLLPSPDDARDYLADISKILNVIHRKLHDAHSPYSELTAILLDHAAKGTAHPLPPSSDEMPGMGADGRADACEGCALGSDADVRRTEQVDEAHV